MASSDAEDSSLASSAEASPQLPTELAEEAAEGESASAEASLEPSPERGAAAAATAAAAAAAEEEQTSAEEASPEASPEKPAPDPAPAATPLPKARKAGGSNVVAAAAEAAAEATASPTPLAAAAAAAAAASAAASAASASATPVAPPRSPSPSAGSSSKAPKSAVKVDAFRFDPATGTPGGLGFDRGAAAPWRAHDPEARLPVEAITPKKTFCIGVGGAALKTFRAAVSKKKKRFMVGDFDLDLSYITPKIIAMGFPSVGREGLYRNPLPEVQRFFETRHAGRYRIYNLCSEKAYDPADFLGRVCRYPFDDHNPCPLHVIAAFCEDVDSWLTAHPDNVAAIHCKAGKGRTGLVISCFLLHCGFKPSAEQALKFFGVQRTANAKGVTIPSQMRYVHYYEQILRLGFPVTYTYRVTHVRIRGVPTLELGSSNCVPWFQLLVDGARVFCFKKASGGSKGLARFRKGEPYMDLDCSAFDVRIANNVKLQVNHEGMRNSLKMCHLWFHTGFVTRNVLVFGRGVIDKLSKDTKGKKVPRNFAVELYLHRVAAMPLAPGEQEAQIAAASARALAAAESSGGEGGSASGIGSPRDSGASAASAAGGGKGRASRRSSMTSVGSARSAVSSGGNSSGSEGESAEDNDDD